MKKIIAIVASFILLFSAVLAGGSWYYDTSISTNANIQTVTIEPNQIIVFSLDKQVETVDFSTDSMFTIRTLEGGEWIDMSNSIADYIPLRGYMVKNLNSFDLDITFTFKNVVEVEKTIFQKTLKAGWNLVGPAYKNDISKQVQILDFLGNSNYSHLLDLTGDSLVYSGENNILTKKTYSGEVPIPTTTTINHIVKGNSQILNSSELSNIKVIEGIAYGIFVPSDTIIPGSQETYNCDEVSQLLGLCDEEGSISGGGGSSSTIDAANALAAAGYINDHSDDTAAYNLNQNVLRQEIAFLTRGISGIAKKTTCNNSFIDVSATVPNDWACYSIEALLDANLIAANTNFYPEGEISKAESLGLIINVIFGDQYSHDNNSNLSWQEQIVNFAVSNGVVANFTDYDTLATRGFVYEASNNALVASTEVVGACDIVGEILGLCTNLTSTEVSCSTNQVFSDNSCNVCYTKTLNGIGSILLPWNNSTDLTKILYKPEQVLPTMINLLPSEVTWTNPTWDYSTNLDSLYSATEEGYLLSTGSTVSLYKNNEGYTLTTNNTSTGGLEIGLLKSEIVTHNILNVSGEISVDANINRSCVLITNKNIGITNTGSTISAPINIGTTNIGTGSIDLAWMGVTDADEYIIYYGTGSYDYTSTGKTINSSFSINSLNEGTNYYLAISAVDLDGNESTKSEELTVKTLGCDEVSQLLGLCSITGTGITNLQATNIGTGSIDLSWDTVTNAIMYYVQYGTGSQNYTIQDDLIEFSPTTINNLTQGTTYYFNIVALDENGGEILTSTEIQVTTQSIISLNTPTNFQVTQTGATQITLSWDPVVNAEDYEVSYSTGEVELLLGLGTNFNNVTGTGINIQGLDTETIYYLGVKAKNGENKSNMVTLQNTTGPCDEVSQLLGLCTIHAIGTATIANVPLANVEVVKGATDLVALQFEIEAGATSDITANQIKIHIDSSGTGATKDQLSEVALYKGSVSIENLLDKKSGTNLISGDALFNGFGVLIGSGSTETFIVTVSTVDLTTVIDKVLTASINDTATNISLQDDESNLVTLNSLNLSDKTITVKDSGQLTLTADSSNTDNQNPKTILAGTEQIIYSTDLLSTNEDVNVSTVIFTLDANLKNVIASAKLYLDDTVVATASNSDVLDATNSTITFDNISNLNIPTTASELKLAIITESIGFEKIGEVISNVSVINVSIPDAQGSNSAEVVTVNDLTTTASNTFDITLAEFWLTQGQDLSTGKAKVQVSVNTGNNTQIDSAAAPLITLRGITVNNSSGNNAVKIYEDGEIIEVNFSSGVIISNNKIFEIIPQDITQGITYTLSIPSNGINYDADTNLGLTSNIGYIQDLGTITY